MECGSERPTRHNLFIVFGKNPNLILVHFGPVSEGAVIPVWPELPGLDRAPVSIFHVSFTQ